MVGPKLDQSTMAQNACCESIPMAVKKERNWGWGHESNLKWAKEVENVRYLGVHVGFCIPGEANFDKLLGSFNKKINALLKIGNKL